MVRMPLVEEQQIGAGGERGGRGLGRAEPEAVAQRAHLERVGHDKAVEAQVAAQQVGQHGPRKSRGHARRINRREGDMR